MPMGLIIGSITPNPEGRQSRLEYTALYKRTMASLRGTPTLYCTVKMATPGRDTEYKCSTPSISPNTCSIGEATRCSICEALAPGAGTMTLAIVTSI